MPALARGQENTPSIINWFITINGTLTDAYAVEYRIFDITGGLPGTQIFPATPGTYETVTTGAGNFSTGSYYAYDNGNAEGWTPGIAEPIGTHRIEWRWKISAGSAWQAGQEDFEVLVQSAGSSADTYITVQDIRDLGVPDPPDDAAVLAAIETWQAFLERACRQWFVPKAMVLQLDGTDSDTLHFGVPIISISYIQINDQGVNLSADEYRVYSATRYPDDRHNPRIKLVNSQDLDIYTAPVSHPNLRRKFRKGRQNQIVSGVFGYVEDDGGVPKLIKRALTKLVIEKLSKPLYVDDATPAALPSPPAILGDVMEEWTDGHKIKYGTAGTDLKPRSGMLAGITDDQEIRDIIRLYRAPIGAATPAHPSFT